MYAEERRREVLHILRLMSVARPEAVAARLDVAVAEVTAALADARSRGFVTERRGRMPGWSLSATGRVEGERLLAEELDGARRRDDVERSYERFLAVNADFLDLCTRWQLVEVDGIEVPNTHADPGRDAALVDELAQLHETVTAITGDLSAGLARFGRYRPRFEYAMARLGENDVDWFTKPLIDSYHTVWFELHEDLLATLGRDRSTERTRATTMEGHS